MTSEQIKKMSLADRVSAMEALWDSMTLTSVEVKSPIWHKQVLARRRKKIAAGKATYLTLTQLKEKLAK